MTSKTSLFNKGIYKSVIRRHVWGSLLYFIILFVITTLPILIGYDPKHSTGYITSQGCPTLYESGFIVPSILLAIVVPTIVGLMVFRIVHSKKTGIFTHSLPVCRNAIFVSSVAAALTLMAAPVILNGLLLLILSFTAYSVFFSTGSCIVWILMNLFTLFIMFACTCFVSMLTGNSFAMIVLNFLIHAIFPIAVGAISVIATTFLYGFSENTNFLTDLIKYVPVVRVVSCAENLSGAYKANTNPFDVLMIFEILGAIVLYGLSLFLYKKRNLETTEDVAGFKVLNPIFKYLITTLGTISVFAIFSVFIQDSPVGFTAIVLILAAVFYFALEMILKKSLKVFKSYKGFIGFTAVFAIIIALFATTSFFGFETRIPKTEDVKSVAIYEYYDYEQPIAENLSAIEEVAKIHTELTDKAKIHTISPTMGRRMYEEFEYNTRIHIAYNLKNGRTINRTYPVSEAEKYEILGRMYDAVDYREKAEQLLSVSDEEIYRINLYNRKNQDSYISDREPMSGLLSAMRSDLKMLDYNQIYCGFSWGTINIEFKWQMAENEYDMVKNINVDINPNFKNTIKWLEENGYAEFSGKIIDEEMFLAPVKEIKDREYKEYSESVIEKAIPLTAGQDIKSGIYLIPDDAKTRMLSHIFDRSFSFFPNIEYYGLYKASFDSLEFIAFLTPEEATEFTRSLR